MSLLKYESQQREPLVDGDKDYHQVTEDIVRPIEMKPSRLWYIGFYISVALLLFGVYSIYREVTYGIGQWNLNKTIGWGWDITNFVWWVGIGHAGTLISAILLLFRQGWRTGVNRAAEAMTIFAVMCAGQFPIWHMGRVWMAPFVLPYPNTRGSLWPNFNSPLLWDVFAISTYFTVSLLFWYSGLIPDLATLRDRAKLKWRKSFYGLASFGWTGSTKHWQRHEALSLVLAGLATPLVLSVHTIVSFDFATSVIPGWHTTIFPPYFVAGAIFGGFAMVLTLLLPARLLYPQLDDMMTRNHVDKMAKIILLTGSIVGYAYLMELFVAMVYSGNFYEYNAFYNRATGWYWWHYVMMMTCNVVAPQVFWMKWARRNYIMVFFICQLVNMGMWYERFVIIGTTLAQDFLPSSWGHYTPSWVEVFTFIGTFGMFITLFLLFMRFLPMITIFEVKAVKREADPHHDPGAGDTQHGETPILSGSAGSAAAH